jgi:Putative porin
MYLPSKKHIVLLSITGLSLHFAATAEEPSGEAADSPSEAAANLAETLDPEVDAPLPTDLPADVPAPAATPTGNVTINLINRLVAKGILSQAEAAEMIQQAEDDAAAVRAEQTALPPELSMEDEMRITYIPEVVRNQMRDQIKQELLAHAREEKWSEKQYPEWTSRLRPFGDLRFRSDSSFFPEGNDNTGAFPNFNAINTGSPFDTSGTVFSPQHNVDQDRHRIRIRARAGAEVMLGEGFDAGIRIASGSDSSPTSTNQSLGGSGGNFSKYAVWLDRAFLSYDAGPGNGDGEELVFSIGRFDNPFFSTIMHWDDDVGFDGLAMRGKVHVNDKVSTFFTAGYFPVYNTDFNFASNQPSKFDSSDKWLLGTQLGVEWKPVEDLTAKFAVAYYDFDGIEGELSSPFIPLAPTDAGDTDATRPSFAQRGNTYRALRNIDNSTAANDFGNKYQYQYYGLATPFENITLTGRVDYDRFEPFRISLVAEATQNIAFDQSEIDKFAVNNRGSAGGAATPGAFEGGDTAWYASFILGSPIMENRWDWQAGFGYRYIESDAVVDAFNDSDFGMGGTNMKGFTIGGDVALSKNVRCGMRWMSADEIAGPPLSSDVLLIDLNAKF